MPKPSRLIFRFWQKTQPSVQPEKNTVPEPFVPLMQGSSQRCLAARARRICVPMPQKPGETDRSAPQARGHSIQPFKALPSILLPS